MKNLTEILKNIKTSGKNLIVYSSMLLALTGSYACGGNDNSGSDGGVQTSQDGSYNPLQDIGNGNSPAVLDCDRLILTLDRCGFAGDNSETRSRCENVKVISQPSYQDAVNKCAEKGACGVVEDCFTSAIASCTPADNFDSYVNAYCKKGAECGEYTTEESCKQYMASTYSGNKSPGGQKCYTSQTIDDSLPCLEKVIPKTCYPENGCDPPKTYCSGFWDCSPGTVQWTDW
jgi:hypothetical protein